MNESEFIPSRLIVHCDEHLATVRKFADETGQREAFEQKLQDLCFFGNPEIRVHLYSDFAPMSFYWEAIVGEGQPTRATRYMNGGLIYHGEVPNYGGGSPTFSVCLTPTAGWSIHT